MRFCYGSKCHHVLCTQNRMNVEEVPRITVGPGKGETQFWFLTASPAQLSESYANNYDLVPNHIYCLVMSLFFRFLLRVCV